MKYRLQDLIDIDQLQALLDKLNEMHSFLSAIVDNDGNILTATAWQDICIKFHRQNEECKADCKKSDQYILNHLDEANPAVSYRCPRGLIDSAMPIIIDGMHLGNFFTGQFFFEEPDLEFFRAQAKRYGFEEKAYLDAVRKVPIWSQEKLNHYLVFIKEMIEIISEIGLNNLQAIEARQKSEESEKLFRAMFDLASIGIAQADVHTGQWLRVNQKMCEITGYPKEELLALRVPEITHPEDCERDWEAFQRVVRGEVPNYRLEKRYIRKDKTVVWVNVNMTVIRDDTGLPLFTMAAIEDITECKFQEEEREITTHLNVQINSQKNLHECMAGLTLSLQEWSGCEAVGIRLRAGDDYPYYETRGFPPTFVQKENHLCIYDLDGEILRDGMNNPVLECMCGNILCGRFDPAKPFFSDQGSFWTNSTSALLARTTDADRQARTRNRCHGEGYESVALIPLRSGNQVFGLMQFNDRRTDRFTIDRIVHFEKMAGNLAIALSRRQVEEALRESNARLDMAQNAAKVGVWDWDFKTDRLIWSTYMFKLFGLDPQKDEASLERWNTILHPEDKEIAGNRIEQALKDKTTLDSDYRVVLPDGQIRWINAVGEGQYDEQGHCVRMIGICMDITERKRAEETLRESREELSMALEVGNAGIWEWNSTLGQVHFDARFHTMLGYMPGELPTTLKEWHSYHHPDDVPTLWPKVEAFIKGTLPVFESEHRIRNKMGLWSWIFTRGKIVSHTATGEPEQFIGIAMNITDRKALETQLLQAQKMESIGRLAGGVAHDFNNMLQVILTHTDMALSQVLDSQSFHTDLEEIRKAAERSSDLTRQLLAFARKQTIIPQVLDLNDTVTGMLKMLSRLIGEDISLVWMPGSNIWPLKIDPSQIDQILANLCVNARDAIADVGKIIIETDNKIIDEDYCTTHMDFLPGLYVRLSVSDNGCGMDKETSASIFEPFFTTKGVGAGTGLGLATVYGIVKQNNGFINVYSELDKGTTFSIYLPRYVGATGNVQKENLSEPILRGDETILLVEDERVILKGVKRILEALGYHVLASSSPTEAIELAREFDGDIHLLITDVIMPEMNGRDLTNNLHPLYPGMKILFMSGYTADVIANHGVLDEGVHFIEKPFSSQNLAVKVREVLND